MMIKRCKYCALHFVPEAGQPEDEYCSDLCRQLGQGKLIIDNGIKYDSNSGSDACCD